MIMADQGESTVTVDEQGRMVLPSRLREKLGIKKGGRLSIRVEDSNKIVMQRRIEDDVEGRVKAWTRVALAEKAQIGVVDKMGKEKAVSPKWMSSDYARRKLGL